MDNAKIWENLSTIMALQNEIITALSERTLLSLSPQDDSTSTEFTQLKAKVDQIKLDIDKMKTPIAVQPEEPIVP